MLIRTTEDVDHYLGLIRQAAADARTWMNAQTGEPLDLFRRMKFDAVGYHPIGGHALNLVEQINQTWTYAVALAAARQLLTLHPEAGGFRLAPGAHAAIPLDIMSEADGLVGAETFAAVDLRNNNKLEKDLKDGCPSRAAPLHFLPVTQVPYRPALHAIRLRRRAGVVRRGLT